MTARKKPTSPVLRSEQREAALEEYEKGIRLLQQKDYQKAIPRFEAVLEGFPGEAALCDRARMYLSVARKERLTRAPARATREPAEFFDVGSFLLNDGDFKEAARYLERAIETAPKDAPAHVALAAARIGLGDVTGCLASLTNAIELDKGVRYRVRTSSDFEPLEDNPEFAALVHADD